MKFIDIPTEQTTAITDALLAILSMGGMLYLRRIKQYDIKKANIWSWVFGLLALSAVLGAIAHGFKMSHGFNQLLWQPLYLLLGVAIALFVIGAVYDFWGSNTAQQLLPFMLGIAFIFCMITKIVPESFLIFIIYEAIAMLFALVVYSWLAIKKHIDGAYFMTVGILVTIIAAGIQASDTISFTLIWEFDHNGIFHLIQMLGVVLILLGLRSAFLSDKDIN